MFSSDSDKINATKYRLDGMLADVAKDDVMYVPLEDIAMPENIIAEVIKLYKNEGRKAWIDGDCIHVEK